MSLFFRYSIQLLTLVILFIAFSNWQQVKKAKLELLVYLQLLSFLVEIIGAITVFYFRNNLITYNLFILSQPLFMLLLIGSWTKTSFLSKSLRMLSAAFFIFWLYESLVVNTIWLKPSNWSMLIGDILTVFAFAVYLIKLSSTSMTPIIRSPRFWTAASYLIYCSGASIILSINENLIGSIQLDPNFPINFRSIHYVIHIIASLFIIKALLCLPKRPISHYSSSFSL